MARSAARPGSGPSEAVRPCPRALPCQHPLADRDLLTGREGEPSLAVPLPAAVRVPGGVRELQAAPVAVPGVDVPVAAALASGDGVPVRGPGRVGGGRAPRPAFPIASVTNRIRSRWVSRDSFGAPVALVTVTVVDDGAASPRPLVATSATMAIDREMIETDTPLGSVRLLCSVMCVGPPRGAARGQATTSGRALRGRFPSPPRWSWKRTAGHRTAPGPRERTWLERDWGKGGKPEWVQ